MKITCQSCGKRYDYDESELCPRCGAYNPVDKQETAAQLIQELEESHQWHERSGQDCDGRDEEEPARRKEQQKARRWGRLSKQGELWQKLTALEDAFQDPPLSQGELCYVDLDISLRDGDDLWELRPYLERMDQNGYLTALQDVDLCARLQEAFPGDPEVLSYYSSVWDSGSYRIWFLLPEGTGELWLNLPEYEDESTQLVESVWRLALPEEEAMILE